MDEEMRIFENTLWMWGSFGILLILVFAFDLFSHRKSRSIKIGEALVWSAVWIGFALLFNLFIYFTQGATPALAFFTGYLVEKALSVDNLFVFLLIFQYFRTPKQYLHKILFWGVLGAIVMRAIFIFLGIALISAFHWLLYLFGVFLIVMGIKFAFEKSKEISPEKNIILRIFCSFVRVTPTYEDDRFFLFKQGKLFATPLFIVLLAIEASDLLFALDSIPVILGITTDPFIVFTSNIFAILGLRSLYFVLSEIMGLFIYLHYALSLILIFIGLKMILAPFFTFPPFLTLGIILLLLTLSIIASLLFPRTKP